MEKQVRSGSHYGGLLARKSIVELNVQGLQLFRLGRKGSGVALLKGMK